MDRETLKEISQNVLKGLIVDKGRSFWYVNLIVVDCSIALDIEKDNEFLRMLFKVGCIDLVAIVWYWWRCLTWLSYCYK